MRRPDADLWYEAACAEMQAQQENGTWELVPLPPGRKAIGSRWVFKIKWTADGSVERYKGRIVAKGYLQRPGIDYSETFAPTAKWAALRAILALSAYEDLYVETVDVSTAFLNGNVHEEIYMRQPEGFEQGGPGYVCKLHMLLYRLKQAGRMWHEKLDSKLQTMGFKHIHCDHSIWVWTRGAQRIIVPVFVDDMTICAKTAADIAWVKSELGKRFKLCDLGPTSFLLGVEIKRNCSKHSMTLSQHQYVIDMLKRYGFDQCKPVSTPMVEERLTKDMAPSTAEEVVKRGASHQGHGSLHC
jgi:hypothetical protein